MPWRERWAGRTKGLCVLVDPVIAVNVELHLDHRVRGRAGLRGSQPELRCRCDWMSLPEPVLPQQLGREVVIGRQG